jgi:NAD(P)H-nitrite reductase large subunit
MVEIVCRCMDVTKEDILKAIEEGYTDIESIQRVTCLGRGPCQGKTCIPIAIGIIARATGKSPEEVGYITPRPPINPVSFELLSDDEEVEE